MDLSVAQLYGNQVRLRICGLCLYNSKLLMVNHQGLGLRNFWAPPGGGVELGQTAYQTLIREFSEEAGIKVKPGEFRFGCEYINDPLHSVELFFLVEYESGALITGFDPEMRENKQIITEVKWMTSEEIKALPQNEIHGVFKLCPEPANLIKLSGYWPI